MNRIVYLNLQFQNQFEFFFEALANQLPSFTPCDLMIIFFWKFKNGVVPVKVYTFKIVYWQSTHGHLTNWNITSSCKPAFRIYKKKHVLLRIKGAPVSANATSIQNHLLNTITGYVNEYAVINKFLVYTISACRMLGVFIHLPTYTSSWQEWCSLHDPLRL